MMKRFVAWKKKSSINQKEIEINSKKLNVCIRIKEGLERFAREDIS